MLGFDISKYDVTVQNYDENMGMGYLGVIPQCIVEYTLTSDEGKIQLFYTFANDQLQIVEVLKDGVVQEVPKTYVIDVLTAKSFLTKYQKYTGNSLYSQLGAMLTIGDDEGNCTKLSENMALEVTVTDEFTTFKWYYVANDAAAPYSKFISLIVKDGVLYAFCDNWHLYPVGSTDVHLSKEDAVAIALEAARNHVWSLDVDGSSLSVENFDESNVRWVSLVFAGSLNADSSRSENPLELYPVWQVGIALDQWYGYMYGVEVDVWADTGEFRLVREAWSSILPEEAALFADIGTQNSSVSEAGLNLVMLVMLPACVILATGFALVWIGRTKKLCHTSLFKKHGFKAGGILLCIIISSTMFLGALETASAVTRGAVVWGSESTGANTNGTSIHPNWRKSTYEIGFQQAAGTQIANYFQAGGYTGNSGINHQGTAGLGSSSNQIKSDISALYSSKDYVAVVDFDHGVGRNDHFSGLNEFHYMFEDNKGTCVGLSNQSFTEYPGNAVYDSDVFSLVSHSKTVFTFISTCMSADVVSYGQGYLAPQFPYPGRARSMPYAWTGRLVADRSSSGFTIGTHISNDGYSKPDWGNQVYMGFIGGSASLEQHFPTNPSNSYFYWITKFLENALTLDKSVNDALNLASLTTMGCAFIETPLRTGFEPYWWNFPGPWLTSYLAVYGNGNIHLKDYVAPSDATTSRYVTGPGDCAIGVSYAFSGFATDPYAHNVKYRFDWGDGTYTETGWCSDGVSGGASHAWGSGAFYNVRVQSQCPNSGWSAWSAPLVVNVGNQPVSHWLTVRAVDGYSGYYPLYPDMYVDGSYVGSGVVTLLVSRGSHSIFMSDSTNSYYGTMAYLWCFSDYYANGASRVINSDTEIIGIYY